jgi:membrane-bound lytic murein transglycosylase MltF
MARPSAVRVSRRCVCLALGIAGAGIAGASVVHAASRNVSANGSSVPDIGNNLAAFTLPVPKPWTGDLDGMRKRRLIRFLVPYSRTFYFIDRGQEMGIVHDFGVAFAEWLNQKYKPTIKSLPIRVSFIPVTRDRLIPELVRGLGDIAAGDLTITPERQKSVDFSAPTLSDLREVVVTGPASPPLSSLDDLAGKDVAVRRSSSFYEHLVDLNKSFKSRGLPEISLRLVEEDLEDEDVLEMVNAKLLSITVIDEPIARLWAQIYKKLTVHDDLVVNQGGDLAWEIRKKTPLLKADIDEFAKTHRMGTRLGNIMISRYTSMKYLQDSLSDADRGRFEQLSVFFKKYGAQYKFDYLMVLAQGYQESQLDQSRRSKSGAIGVMQLLPATAKDPVIGVPDIDKSAEKNIEAGVKYLRYLADTYLDDPKIDDKNRTLMVFAAYNAGPGNLQKFRRIAEKSGLNPNIWFSNVEIAAARAVGRQTVDYVSNIYKYYVAYKLSAEQQENRTQSREQLKTAPPAKAK